MSSKFYHFKNGKKISNWQINIWLEQCRDVLLSGKEHHRISSGDTSVSAHKWESEFQFCVSNSDGHSSLRLTKDDINTHHFDYERPETPLEERAGEVLGANIPCTGPISSGF